MFRWSRGDGVELGAGVVAPLVLAALPVGDPLRLGWRGDVRPQRPHHLRRSYHALAALERALDGDGREQLLDALTIAGEEAVLHECPLVAPAQQVGS